MPAVERRYSISYPESSVRSFGIPKEVKYYSWKSTLYRFADILIKDFNFLPSILKDLEVHSFLESDKALLQDLTRLLKVPRLAHAFRAFFSPSIHQDILFQPRSESRDQWVAMVNAVEHHLLTIETDRYKELFSREPHFFHRLYKEVSAVDIRTRAWALDLAMSFIDSPVLFDMWCQDCLAHKDRDEYLLPVWMKVFATMEQVDAYLAHPHREAVHNAIPLNDLVSVYTWTYDRRSVSPLFWLEYPKLLKLVTKLREAFPFATSMKAGEKLLIFQLLMSAVGRHGVTEEELLAQVFAFWEPQPEKYLKLHPQPVPIALSTVEDRFYQHLAALDSDIPMADRKFQALERMSVGQQREWLSQIKSGDPVRYPLDQVGLESSGMKAVRAAVRRRKGIPENLSSKELLPDAERSNWLESPYHPLYKYLCFGGFEIEANYPAEMTDRTLAPHLYRVIGQFGYANGNDQPIELSPNPLLRPEHVSRQFTDYVNAGLLDPHAETQQSAHMNIEVYSRETMAYLFRLCYLTGLSSHPLRQQESPGDPRYTVNADRHELRIYVKTSEAQHGAPAGRNFYVEAKGLRVTTPNDFRQTIRLMMILGAAGRAYEQCWLILNKMSVDTLRQRQSRSSTDLPIYFPSRNLQLIHDKSLRQLAGIWDRFTKEAALLTKHSGFLHADFWNVSTPQRQVNLLGAVVRDIFPTPFAHDDLERLSLRSADHASVHHDDLVFPNVVAAARHLSEKYIQQIRGVHQRELDRFRKDLTRLRALSEGLDKDLARDDFLFDHYGSRVLVEKTTSERRELFDTLNFYLLDDPLLHKHDYNIPE
jgi:hypothetical protein